jgi:hypothetical protein
MSHDHWHWGMNYIHQARHHCRTAWKKNCPSHMFCRWRQETLLCLGGGTGRTDPWATPSEGFGVHHQITDEFILGLDVLCAQMSLWIWVTMCYDWERKKCHYDAPKVWPYSSPHTEGSTEMVAARCGSHEDMAECPPTAVDCLVGLGSTAIHWAGMPGVTTLVYSQERCLFRWLKTTSSGSTLTEAHLLKGYGG